MIERVYLRIRIFTNVAILRTLQVSRDFARNVGHETDSGGLVVDTPSGPSRGPLENCLVGLLATLAGGSAALPLYFLEKVADGALEGHGIGMIGRQTAAFVQNSEARGQFLWIDARFRCHCSLSTAPFPVLARVQVYAFARALPNPNIPA
ncbi:Hypothetical protein BJL86_1656 [Dietzia timorensis]|uniref:Uncharacterized protein n=1 Tax=Dietzia timorensis TaxID=499555 RepID=A0A173LNZ5_9ACTN|nr:Hypothetical protein BJL86_1656 [Dietzia timorensis]